jgi:hypothetical protein
VADPRLPDFFIVGHPKGGTSALSDTLSRHPQIFMSDPTEPNYFAPDIVRPQYSREGYMSLFAQAGSERLAGEASTWYLTSRMAARAISEVRPPARIIAVFREPASFVRSLHLQMRQVHVETEPDLRSALALEAVRRRSPLYAEGLPRSHANEIRKLMYSEHLEYAAQLRRYHDSFPQANVLVLIYDDLKRDYFGTVRAVFRFLEVDDQVQVENNVINPTVRVRLPGLHLSLARLAKGQGGAAHLKHLIMRTTNHATRKFLIDLVERRILFTEPPPEDKELTRELKERYASKVADLSAYLGRDLVSEWGYARSPSRDRAVTM